MNLEKRVSISLIGSLVILVGLFVTALNGVVPGGLDSNGSISLYQMEDGQIILVACVILLAMHASKASVKYTWIGGLVILAFTVFSFIVVNKNISNLAPMWKAIVSFGLGYFAVMIGCAIVAFSVAIEMSKETKTKSTENNNKDEKSIADELIKLSDLLSKGILTQEEFDTQKAKLLKSEESIIEEIVDTVELPDDSKTYDNLDILIEEFKNIGATISSQNENNIVFAIADQEISYRRNLNKKDEEWLRR